MAERHSLNIHDLFFPGDFYQESKSCEFKVKIYILKTICLKSRMKKMILKKNETKKTYRHHQSEKPLL